MANDASTSKTVAARINRQKIEVLKFLAETPVVATACRKADVSRATYYRWLEEDPLFAQKATKASSQGRAFRCDMAESVLYGKVAEKDLGAAKYVLEHHHPTYMPAPKVPALDWREERARRKQDELDEQMASHPPNLESRKRDLGRRYEEELRQLIVNSIRNKPNDST